nr:TIGR03663 family protein [Solirubrobacterales bacterium]
MTPTARSRLRDAPRLELAAYAALIALALGLRLIDLGSRPFHHDESQDAYFSWVFFTQGEYAYNPLLHGPLRFYLTTAMYEIFGAGDVSARLAPALMGATMVGLPSLLRAQLGRGGALVAAALLAVGPSYLYFSRFAREDIYIACITLGLMAVVLHFLDVPRRHHPPLIGALLAASFATKESTFITVFVAGTFLGPLALWQARRDGWRDAPLLRSVMGLGWRPWAWGVAAFWFVFALLFTVFFTNPGGLWDGIYDGLAYWLGQQPVARGGEPVGFYAFLLLGEEWPVVGLAAVGIVAVIRSPSVGRWLLVWMFGLSLAVYS